MKKIFTKVCLDKKFLFYFLFANLYFLLSLIPLFIMIKRTPNGVFYSLDHTKTPYDYHMYLSAITQGKNGAWLMTDPYTSEATRPTLFYFYYLALGKIFAPLHLYSHYVYHLGRIISVEVFIISVYLFLTTALGKQTGFLASLISISATISPFRFFNEPQALLSYTPWWENLEATKRLNIMPHYLFGFALGLISSAAIVRFIKENKLKYLLPAIITIFLAGIVFPPSILPIIFGFPISYLICQLTRLISQKKLSVNPTHFLGLSLIISCSIISLALIWRENQNGFPWDFWNKWEIDKWNYNEPNFNHALLFAFGILPIFSLLAVYQIFQSRKWERLFLAIWAYFPFLLLPFIKILGISKLRLVSTAPFIPLAGLTSIALLEFNLWRKKIMVKYLLIAALFATFIPVSYQMSVLEIQNRLNSPLYTNIFYPLPAFQALRFIEKNIPKNSVILSNEYMGNIIPAFAPVISFYGHFVHTKNFFSKAQQISSFYSNKMSEEQAKKFLTNGNIRYIYYGPDEYFQSLGNLNYTFLEKIYQNSQVVIFKVL